MRRSTGCIVALSLACVVCGVVIVRQQFALDGLRISASSYAPAGAVDEPARLNAAMTQLREDAAARARFGKELKRSAVPVAPPVDFMKAYMAIRKDPEHRRLEAIAERQTLLDHNAELYGLLHLPADKLEQYQTLLVERYQSEKDARFLAMEQDVYPGDKPEEFTRIVASITDPIDASIHDLIGDTGVATAVRYAATTDQRTVATQLQIALSYTSAPLTPAQRDQVIQVLVDHPMEAPGAQTHFSLLDPSGSIMPNVVPWIAEEERGTMVTEDALNAAAGILSQQQLEAFQQVRAFQLGQQAIQRNFEEAVSPGPSVK